MCSLVVWACVALKGCVQSLTCLTFPGSFWGTSCLGLVSGQHFWTVPRAGCCSTTFMLRLCLGVLVMVISQRFRNGPPTTTPRPDVPNHSYPLFEAQEGVRCG